jgi:ABC-type transport system involved in cytochrome c biogenesis permease component
MRWLFLKDLQILRRSPLLLALLVLYPIVIAVLIGFALSRGPEEPRVAFLNQVPESANTISLGGEEVDASRYAEQLFDVIEPVRVSSRDEAIQLVEDGDVLAALIIPPDITQKLEAGLEPASVEVFYNAEDPAKQAFVESTIESEVADANAALTELLAGVALEYIDVLVEGGEFALFGESLEVLGLDGTERILEQAKTDLPAGSPAREQIDQIIEFTTFAQENVGLSDDVLASVGQPIQVDTTVVDGGTTPLSSFAVAIAVSVSLMFVTVLLAAGTLALEREEDAFRRLVRGLVSRSALLVEKVGLAAACAFVVALVMMAGLALFVDLDWSRFPLWLAALAGGAVAFGAMGVALGAVAREVRAASLLAFMLSLPIAFLALVPSGAVSSGLYEAIQVISALFPFKPTLDAVDAALNDAGGIAVPLLHLAALALAFGLLGRLALRRFA